MVRGRRALPFFASRSSGPASSDRLRPTSSTAYPFCSRNRMRSLICSLRPTASGPSITMRWPSSSSVASTPGSGFSNQRFGMESPLLVEPCEVDVLLDDGAHPLLKVVDPFASVQDREVVLEGDLFVLVE